MNKPIVFNYQKYKDLEEENARLREKIANLEVRCRIAEEDKPIEALQRSGLIDLYIRDKDLNIVRRIGDNHHDMLLITRNGELEYHNLQNGGGCRTGEPSGGWYEFVPNEDDHGYNYDPRREGHHEKGNR